MTRLLSHSLQVRLSALILVLVLTVGGVIGWLAYSRMTGILDQATTALFDRIEVEALLAVEQLYQPAEVAVEMLTLQRINDGRNMAQRSAEAGYLKGVLDQSPEVTAVFVGYDDGDFILFRRMEGEAAAARFDAPARTAYLLQHIEREAGEETRGHFLYYDRNLVLLRLDDRPDYIDYDPRERPWYQTALQAGTQYKTEPYVFFTTRELGSTVAMRARGRFATVGVDITLSTLADILVQQRMTPGTEILLVDSAGKIIAHPNPDAVLLIEGEEDAEELRIRQRHMEDMEAAILPLIFQQRSSGGSLNPESGVVDATIDVDGDRWRTMVTPVPVRGTEPYYLVAAIPEAELLAEARALLQQGAIIIAGILALAALLTLVSARQIARPVKALATEADKIRRFNFNDPVAVRSSITEINDLSRAMNSMKQTIQRFLQINEIVSAEPDFDRLLDTLLREVSNLVGASHGALYLYEEPSNSLRPAALWGMAPELPGKIDFGHLPEILTPILTDQAAYSIPVAGEDLALCGGDPELEDVLGTRNAVIVPLHNRNGSLNGVMAVVRDERGDGSLVNFVDALSFSAATSLETQQLIQAQKELFDSFIKMIAGAIDAKSPYTGGHCERVPELTQMLAEAAHRTRVGPYRDFSLDEDEREAIRLAAWLHDCGKVTTPEYVVDKATKLETIYDRIHEIRTRFEVLKQEANAIYWQRQVHGIPEAEARADRDATLEELDAEFAFVAECNIGGEFMDPERQARLDRIAQRRWPRTLPERAGIGHIEAARFSDTPESLPCRAPLLSDRPEHIIPRAAQDRLEPDNPHGFRMDQPEDLYNRGELYNLKIARGTLSDEERFKINEHIVQTIIMLEKLPFPKHLRHVPELAGGHHEKMDGTGYPKKLTGAQMSPVARMMAVADIFEALTATDRPYKKGKTLSEALKIMGFMVKDRHIDAEIYDLFLTSGVWKDYAERYLKPEQIEEIDVDGFRPKPPIAAE